MMSLLKAVSVNSNNVLYMQWYSNLIKYSLEMQAAYLIFKSHVQIFV